MRFYCIVLLTLATTKTSLCEYFNYIDIVITKNGRSVVLQLADTVNHEKEALSVIIMEQNITKLQSGTFQNLPKLKVIKIQDCQMTDVEEGAFINLPKLRVLNLGYNLLKTIKKGVFQNLEITELYLGGNAISDIEEGALNNITNLEVIDLSNNQIVTLHQFMFRGTMYLRKINLSFNYIQTVPNNFFEDAFSNTFKDQDSFIDLSDNRIDYLDVKTFKGVHYVKRLDLKNNNLRTLNSNIFEDIRVIEALNLENNNLESLNYNVLTRLESASEINLFANPWRCEFVKIYESWCEKYNKDNSIIDYDTTQCTNNNTN